MRFFVERIPFDPALSAPRRREMDGPVLVPEGQGVVFRVRTERNSEDPFRRQGSLLSQAFLTPLAHQQGLSYIQLPCITLGSL